LFVNVTPLPLTKFSVWNADELPDALNAWLLCDVSALCDAVIAEPADVPKLIPFALLSDSVENAYEPFWPDTATGWVLCCVSPLWLAVICEEPDIPKVMPLLFPNVMVPLVAVCVPA
jgi:hypothetical protein